MVRYAAEDGRAGLGWIEWNQPDPRPVNPQAISGTGRVPTTLHAVPRLSRLRRCPPRVTSHRPRQCRTGPRRRGRSGRRSGRSGRSGHPFHRQDDHHDGPDHDDHGAGRDHDHATVERRRHLAHQGHRRRGEDRQRPHHRHHPPGQDRDLAQPAGQRGRRGRRQLRPGGQQNPAQAGRSAALLQRSRRSSGRLTPTKSQTKSYGGKWIEVSALDSRFQSFDHFLDAGDLVSAVFQGHTTPLAAQQAHDAQRAQGGHRQRHRQGQGQEERRADVHRGERIRP